MLVNHAHLFARQALLELSSNGLDSSDVSIFRLRELISLVPLDRSILEEC
jgi:hypothetical protein